ncbi:MAG: UDP-N-acetylmuramoyl-L-alanyl-D-glutamate--2,6-diaminopimelate ligase, partial [Actinomycetia bacterium]|nr:UDP-N-acetylmuramoyl-L-alanyl-D-glutamate--2,6-diaminopimelate ligase [Actinomycetes bacterium]
MKIKDVQGLLDLKEIKGDMDIDIKGLAYDSRLVKPGDLFFCIRGYNTDGHDYVRQAINNGCIGLVCERKLDAETPQVIVRNSREAMAKTAAAFFNYPSQSLLLVGVTGTNGKTTITYLLESIFYESSKKTGLIGTIENQINRKSIPVSKTTPESIDLKRTLREMVEKKVDVVCMEVSSHAIALKRVDETCFDGLMFTNLTHDHLDFHKTVDDYYKTKKCLFQKYPESIKLINIDDEFGFEIFKDSEEPKKSFSINKKADYKAENIKLGNDGSDFEIIFNDNRESIKTKLAGLFNVYNN